MQRYLAVLATAMLSFGVAACGSSSHGGKKNAASKSTTPSSSTSTPASTPASTSTSTPASTATTTSTSTPSTSSTASASTSGTSTDSAAYNAAKQGCDAGIKNNPAIAASKQGVLSTDCQKVAAAAATGVLSKYKAEYTVFCSDLAAAVPAAASAATKTACKQGESALH